MDTSQLQLRTGDRLVTDITDAAARFCRTRGDGLLNVFVPHATAGIAVMETGSGSEGDLGEAIDRLLPADDRYRHRHGSTGHGRDHVLPAFISPSVTVPVQDGARPTPSPARSPHETTSHCPRTGGYRAGERTGGGRRVPVVDM